MTEIRNPQFHDFLHRIVLFKWIIPGALILTTILFLGATSFDWSNGGVVSRSAIGTLLLYAGVLPLVIFFLIRHIGGGLIKYEHALKRAS